MTRAASLLMLATVILALAGVADSPVWSPVLIVLGGGVGRWGWVLADRDDLIRMFG